MGSIINIVILRLYLSLKIFYIIIFHFQNSYVQILSTFFNILFLLFNLIYISTSNWDEPTIQRPEIYNVFSFVLTMVEII